MREGYRTLARAAAAVSGAAASMPVRFHLPGGGSTVLSCSASEAVADIKARIWKSKSLAAGGMSEADYVVAAAPGGEVWVRDDELGTRLFRAAAVFAEGGAGASVHLAEARVVHRNDVGDAAARARKRPGEGSPIEAQGVLYKRGRTASSAWKKRYFVLQGVSLFYFESEKAFHRGAAEAIGVVPVGSIPVSRTSDVHKGRANCFMLEAARIWKREIVLCAESSEEREMWVRALERVSLRRCKTMCVRVVDDIIRRGVETHEGIFRLAGSGDEVARLQDEFGHGREVDLEGCRDADAVAGVMKRALRGMAEPLLTHARYDQFVRAGTIEDEAERADTLVDVVASLPPENLAFLAYVCEFLHWVSLHAETNMMTAKNLGIVFGPNILRPEDDTAMSALNDTRGVVGATEALIGSFPQMWQAVAVEDLDVPEDEDEAGSDSDSEFGGGAGAYAAAAVEAEDGVHMMANPLMGMPQQQQQQQQRQQAGEQLPPPPPAKEPSQQRSATFDAAGAVASELKDRIGGGGGGAGARPQVTRELSRSAGARRRSSILKRGEAAASTTVPGMQVVLLKKGADDAGAKFGKRLREKTAATDAAWGAVNASLARGGAPSRAVHDQIEACASALARLQASVLAKMDEMRDLVTAAASDIDANHALEVAAAEAAAAEARAREESDAPPPPPPPERSRAPTVAAVPEERKSWAVAQFAYPGGHRADEITLAEGERVEVLDSGDESGWWEGVRSSDGKQGWFPGNYCALEE